LQFSGAGDGPAMNCGGASFRTLAAPKWPHAVDPLQWIEIPAAPSGWFIMDRTMQGVTASAPFSPAYGTQRTALPFLVQVRAVA